MRAVEFSSPGRFALVDRPVPEPGPGELLIAVESVGICGTDLRILAGDYDHAPLPVIPGHEFSGVVARLGPYAESSGIEVGTRVTADPNIWCGECEWCLKGALNLCLRWQALGLTRSGALAEYVTVPARLAVGLPDDVDAAAGAMIEPLSCVLHGVDRAGLSRGDDVLVYGGGTIGLLLVIVARQLGARPWVVEPHQSRRELACAQGALGADAVVSGLPESAPESFDVVVDASGAPAAIADGLTRLRTRGTYLQMGVAPTSAQVAISPYQIYLNEWRLIGSNSVESCFADAAELMSQIAPSVTRLVTHRLPLEQIGDALELMRGPDAVKVQLDPRSAS